MKNLDKLCSIIVRTKNEERWIHSCLKAIYNQKYKNFEVIIVDNNSTDTTLDKARKFPINKIINIEKYLPGDSLNRGIKSSKGDYIVCISAHCIPVNDSWLGNLVFAIEEQDEYAGVYGRQEPMSFSKLSDKRDLLIVFGLDKKVQIKDSFFHNANSIIKRELWEINPFDSLATNIEDRLWAEKILSMGYKIAYEPSASVYHYHGIHQDGDEERLNGVLGIIEGMDSQSKFGKLDIDNMNIVAIIPISRIRNMEKSNYQINDKPQFSYTIDAAMNSKHINKVIVTTDDEKVMKQSIKLGAECPFIRPKELSEEYIANEEVQKYTLAKLEEVGILPDLVVHLEETFPLRKSILIDQMIEDLIHFGYDTVIAARNETGYIWRKDKNNEERYVRLDSGSMPRAIRETSFIGLKGLCCVTHPSFIRNGYIIGENVGLHVVDSPISTFEVRDEASRSIVGRMLQD